MHDPIVTVMRHQKTQLKRITKARGKKDSLHATRLRQAMPSYRLDHVVRERYPTFTDALRDLDDALCMVHLFAVHAAFGKLHADAVADCQRLVLEWQAYCVRSGALVKAFVSVKGVYYQAVVAGVVVNWLAPHQFTQDFAADVDYRVMFTFLELHRTVLRFSLYKLYTDAGFVYPPTLSAEQLEDVVDPIGEILAGGTLADNDLDRNISDFVARISGRIAAARADVDGDDDDDDEGGDNAADADADDADDGTAAAVSRSQQRLSTLDVKSIAARDKAVDETAETVDDDAVGPAQFAALAQDADTAQETHRLTRDAATAQLFRGATFFLAREVPRGVCELPLRAFGARVSWPGGPIDEADASITHHVIDRPLDGNARLGRHYVQPQWIFDSVNNGALMPLSEYAPGAVLPPHMSPFVDDDRVGYVPAFKQRITALLARAQAHRAALEATGHIEVGEPLSLDQAAAEVAAAEAVGIAAADVVDFETLLDPEALEERHQRELEAEVRGESFAQHSIAEKAQFVEKSAPKKTAPKKRKFDRVAEVLGVETEEEAMAAQLGSKKQRKAVSRIAYRKKNKDERIEALEKKRSAVDAKKGKNKD
jgi:pescadillo protein